MSYTFTRGEDQVLLSARDADGRFNDNIQTAEALRALDNAAATGLGRGLKSVAVVAQEKLQSSYPDVTHDFIMLVLKKKEGA